jgi:hypothetical protein
VADRACRLGRGQQTDAVRGRPLTELGGRREEGDPCHGVGEHGAADVDRQERGLERRDEWVDAILEAKGETDEPGGQECGERRETRDGVRPRENEIRPEQRGGEGHAELVEVGPWRPARDDRAQEHRQGDQHEGCDDARHQPTAESCPGATRDDDRAIGEGRGHAGGRQQHGTHAGCGSKEQEAERAEKERCDEGRHRSLGQERRAVSAAPVGVPQR